MAADGAAFDLLRACRMELRGIVLFALRERSEWSAVGIEFWRFGAFSSVHARALFSLLAGKKMVEDVNF